MRPDFAHRRASSPPWAGRARGFTLIETIVVIVITGIVMAIGANLVAGVFNAYFTGKRISDADAQGRLALERMSRELRTVRSTTAADLAFSGTQLRFIDTNGNAICYGLTGTTLVRGSDAPPLGASCATNARTLAANIASLDFYFLQNDGQTAAGTAAQVYYVTTVMRVSTNEYDERLRVTVRPRGVR
jgi:prepilin-type N-terminal cleavage/methylation domain-containing protein